jgi:hypothetical protein
LLPNILNYGVINRKEYYTQAIILALISFLNKGCIEGFFEKVGMKFQPKTGISILILKCEKF